MICTVDRKLLKGALATVKACLPLKPLNDHEANPLLSIESGKMAVTATDMSQVCSVVIPVSSPDSFSMSLDVKKLEKVLAKTDNGDVTIEYGMGGSARIHQPGSEGFVEIPSLPVTKVPVFDRMSPGETAKDTGTLSASVLSEGLSFAGTFMPDVVERNPKYDFVLVRDGMVYGANGINRRGFFVSPALRYPGELKFLKKFVPTLAKLLKSVPAGVVVKNMERVISVEAEDGSFSYACIKARTDAPDVPLSFLTSSGAHTELELLKVLKAMERITIPDYQSAGASVGVSLLLSPADGDDAADLTLKLVSAGKFSGKEKVLCKRIGESDENGGPEVDKVVDFKMFKELASAMPSGGELKVFMNDPESRFFKLQSKHVVAGANCVSVAAGSYARINRVS